LRTNTTILEAADIPNDIDRYEKVYNEVIRRANDDKWDEPLLDNLEIGIVIQCLAQARHTILQLRIRERE